MVKIVYGRNVTTGEIEGFSPGNNEFEISLDRNMKLLLTSNSQNEYEMFTRMRVLMNTAGLSKLRNSLIDFNVGKVEILDSTVKDTVKPIYRSVPAV